LTLCSQVPVGTAFPTPPSSHNSRKAQLEPKKARFAKNPSRQRRWDRLEPVPAPLTLHYTHCTVRHSQSRKPSREHIARRSRTARRLRKARFTSAPFRASRGRCIFARQRHPSSFTCASACFALSGNSIPAAPALRMPASCGGRYKCEVGIDTYLTLILRSRSFSRYVEGAYGGDARHRRPR
jgi:hypothetical protein